MSILDTINNIRIKKTGAVVLPVTEKEEEKRYKVSEVLASSTPIFIHQKPTQLTIPLRNQYYTSSCTVHGIFNQLTYEGIIDEVKYNPAPLPTYRKRYNYSAEGSDGFDIYRKIKAGLQDYPLTPQGATETYANNLPYTEGVTGKIKDFEYYWHSHNNQLTHETIINHVAQNKAVAIYIYATVAEWSKEYVEVIDTKLTLDNAPVRHCVCLIPSGDFTENGKEWLAVHDSAGFGGRFLRYISADFLVNRTYRFACSVYEKTEIGDVLPPTLPVPPLVPVKYGDTNLNVLKLQQFLAKNGKLDPRHCTSYYGSITSKAVLWWQLEHYKDFEERGTTIPDLLDLDGKYWGKQSVEIVNT